MKYNLLLIYFFTINIVFGLFGSLMILEHQNPDGARAALIASTLHGLIGLYLVFRKIKSTQFGSNK